MYDINTITLLYPNGACGALSNICHGNGVNKYATVQDLQDAVEDSQNSTHLVMKLSDLDLIGMDDIIIDRDTAEYTRVRGHDCFGNINIIKIMKKKRKLCTLMG